MDRRLFEAAIRRNDDMLLQLLQDDPLLLDQVMSECTGKENPLHLGALYGHVGLVREMLSRKLELARELNSQGQSPLHLASARGHVEVVKEILSKDADACFVRDRDGMIPLHVAAFRGRVEVLEELVNANKSTAFLLTESGEPILHLCAKNNKFKALKKSVELVQDDEFVKLKDSDDNTILHLLSDENQSEVIRFLVQNGSVDVNAVNMDGFMPLDVSILKLRGHKGWDTDFILIDAGAKRTLPIFGMSVKSMIGSWSNEALLVVAMLMVSVAFQAGLNPPGGLWQDTGYDNSTLLSPNPPQIPVNHHYAGQSVMSHVDPKSFKLFYVLNDLTLTSSMFVIVLLLKGTFVNSLLHKFLAVCFTLISVCTLWASHVVSIPFISSDVLKLPIFFVVFFSSVVVFVMIIPPNIHVVCYETLPFASGSRTTSAVESRAVGRT